MIATYTEPVRTPLTFAEAAECARWAFATPSGLSEEAVALCLAKTAFETGRWQKIWNDNFGNMKCPESQPGMYTAFACGEDLADGSWTFTPEGVETCVSGKSAGVRRQPRVYSGPPRDDWHPQTRFMAFANRFDGIQQYNAFLQRPRYLAAYQKLLTGSATEYVHALKVAGYFTGPEDVYARSVASMQREFLNKLRGLSVPETPIQPELEAEVERLQCLWFATVLADDFASEEAVS